jgi:hypothetical protein
MSRILLLLGLICILYISTVSCGPKWWSGYKGYRALNFAPKAYGYNYGQHLLRSAYGANYLSRPYLYNPYLSTYNPYSNPYYHPYTYNPYSAVSPAAYHPYAGYTPYSGYTPYAAAPAYNPYAYRPAVYHPVYTRPLPAVYGRPFVGGARPFWRREANLDEAQIDDAMDADSNEAEFDEATTPAPVVPGSDNQQQQQGPNLVPIPIQPVFDNEDLDVDVKVKVVKGETLAEHLAHLQKEAAAQMNKMLAQQKQTEQSQPKPVPQPIPAPQPKK